MAALALASATLTGSAAAGMMGGAMGGAGSMEALYGIGAYLALTGVALFRPAAIAAQVVLGQLLAARVLLGPGAPDPLALLPLVAGVVATAELTALAARLDTPVPRDPRAGLREAGLATVVGGAAYGVVALLAGLPGPTGLWAVALASGACVVLAVLLVRNAR